MCVCTWVTYECHVCAPSCSAVTLAESPCTTGAWPLCTSQLSCDKREPKVLQASGNIPPSCHCPVPPRKLELLCACAMNPCDAIWGRCSAASLTIHHIIDYTLYFVAHASNLLSCIVDCADDFIKRILGIGNCTHHNSMQPAAVSHCIRDATAGAAEQQAALLGEDQVYFVTAHLSQAAAKKQCHSKLYHLAHAVDTMQRASLHELKPPCSAAASCLECSSVPTAACVPMHAPVHSSASAHRQMKNLVMLTGDCG